MATPQAQLTEKIIRIAVKSNDFMSKPRIRGLKIINLLPLINGCFSYEKATFELVDSYTHPVTHEKMIDVYSCEFDGQLSWTCQTEIRQLLRAY